MVTQTLKYREDNNIVRNDYLHVVCQLKKDTSKFTDIDVTAHAAGFFGEGYETSSILMSFVLFEIASNPSVQKKLRDEINAVFEENGRKLPYEALQGMSYLDGVVNGVLQNLKFRFVISNFRNITCPSTNVLASKNLH